MGYITTIFNRASYKRVVARTELIADQISEGLQNVCLVHRGLSGSLIAHPAAMSLNTYSLHMRKPGGDYHGCIMEPDEVYGHASKPWNFVIVDDFMDMGSTMKAMIPVLKKTFKRSKVRAIILYDEEYFSALDQKLLAKLMDKNELSVFTFSAYSGIYRKFIYYGAVKNKGWSVSTHKFNVKKV